MTITNRIEPSGHLFLTSFCVTNDPTRTPALAAPSGSTSPKVAHPAVSRYVASVSAGQAADGETQIENTTPSNVLRQTPRSLPSDDAPYETEGTENITIPPESPAYHSDEESLQQVPRHTRRR
ncbi:MAG: hypothetical protein IMZ62_15215 [Chloroflexi bacterium]|nr:hypothetical protein [Chloroflexota bacterium]